tara:strand:- start:507 stop:737 length:231 start_codon:yes stop_codon:yes gene_type:complete
MPQRVMPLSVPRAEYDQSNESNFRADVYRALIALQQRLDVAQQARSDELARMTLRRNISAPSIGVTTNGGGEGWGY